MHPRHARIALRLCRNAADAHEGCNGRHSCQRKELAHIFCCIRENNAAAHKKQGLTCCRQSLRSCVDCPHVERDVIGVTVELDCCGVLVVDRCIKDILCHVNDDDTGAP